MLGIFFMGKYFLDCGENQVQDNKNNKRSRRKNLLLVFASIPFFYLVILVTMVVRTPFLLLLCMA